LGHRRLGGKWDMKKFDSIKLIENLDNHYLNSDLIYHYKKNRALIISILNAFQKTFNTKTLSTKSYELIFTGLQHSFDTVYYEVTGINLIEMSAIIPELKEILTQGLYNKHWRVRFNTVIVGSMYEDEALKISFLKAGLNDKSKRVVEKACELATFSEPVKNLFPHVRKVIKSLNDDVQGFINANMAISEKGYFLNKDKDGDITITIGITNGQSCFTVSKSELANLGEQGVYNKYKQL